MSSSLALVFAPGVTLCRLMTGVASEEAFDVKPPGPDLRPPEGRRRDPAATSLNIRGFARTRALRHAGRQVQALDRTNPTNRTRKELS